ncbi:NAD dependent epimerase/dehydratase family protein [Diplocarpon mali]|nr:NAD dependent epimerase/dehydratase family protein [Diplocarpon mali]
MATHIPKTQSIHSSEIYHGLPAYPPQKPQVAIVTGANGISGFNTLRVLAAAPERWGRIYALSRRPPPPKMLDILGRGRERVEHVSCDFLCPAVEILAAIKERVSSVDFIFFYSYLQPAPKQGAAAWSNAQKLVEINSKLLRNFLEAICLAEIKPKRFLLQTGAKNYGAHLGTALTPAVESDPRITIEPNFYYPQEDMLLEYCREEGVGWNVMRPSWIIGATTNAQMNITYGLGLYAVVQAYLKKPLLFPGDLAAWETAHTHSSAQLTGYQSEHAVLEDRMRDQDFNATDGTPFSWGRLWPLLAGWYGTTAGRPELDQKKYQSVTMPHSPPPRGWGPATTYRNSFSITAWASDPVVKQAWSEIVLKESLDNSSNPFSKPEEMFPFLDGALWAMDRLSLSETKCRKFGWHGVVDTYESIFKALGEFAKLGLLPEMKVRESGVPL